MKIDDWEFYSLDLDYFKFWTMWGKLKRLLVGLGILTLLFPFYHTPVGKLITNVTLWTLK